MFITSIRLVNDLFKNHQSHAVEGSYLYLFMVSLLLFTCIIIIIINSWKVVILKLMC